MGRSFTLPQRRNIHSLKTRYWPMSATQATLGKDGIDVSIPGMVHIAAHYIQSGSVHDAKRSGRRGKTSLLEYTSLRRIALSKRQKPVSW